MVQNSTILYSEQCTIQLYIQANWFKAQQYFTVYNVLYNYVFRLTGSKLSSTVQCTVIYTTVYSG